MRVDDVDLDRDRTLVARFQDGDVVAFEELYRRYFDRLTRFCQRRVGDRHVAEEIAQDTYVRALSALPTFAGEQRFYPWMTVIAGRLCIDHARRAGRVQVSDEIDLGAAEAADSALLDRERAARVREALARVTERHRDVLVLREAEGLSYQAIADRLDAPVTTVETLLHRARRALRRELDVLVGPGGLIALPAVLLRAGRSWQRRVAGRLPAQLPDLSPLVAPLAAAAVVVSMAGAPAATSPAPRPDAVVDVGTVPAPGAGAPKEVPPSPGGGGAVADAGGTSSGPGPSDPGSVTPAAEAPVEVWTGPEGAGRARDESEQMPVKTSAGPVFMGADPAQVVDEVGDVAGTLLGGQR